MNFAKRSSSIARVVAVVFVLGAAAVSVSAQTTSSSKAAAKVAAPMITLTTKPSPPKTGDNEFIVTVKDAKGQPIANAEVSVTLVMPAMPAMKMAEMRNEVKLKFTSAGNYQGVGQVMMVGKWNVTVTVRQDGKEIGTTKLTVVAR